MHISLAFLTLLTTSIAHPVQHPMSASKPTIYFGYGSNLWLQQMSIRCPSALYLGIARLPGYTWLINDRGYANVVSSNSSSSSSTTTTTTSDADGENKYDNIVYGMVYSLTPADEARLDKNEGVPIAYTKEYLATEFWSAGDPAKPLGKHRKIDTEREEYEKRDMLVYIDRQRVAPDEPRKEYVYRMNQGISDALEVGVPRGYVDEVMRRFIPDEEGDPELKEFARGQAARFRDESGVFR